MRTEWIPKGEMAVILSALSPENRLACEISLATGLRINDVLALTPEKVSKGRFTVREEKTGKCKTIKLRKELISRALLCSGQHYVFEHRLNGRLHRTRQAVYKDIKKACRNFGIKENVAPHSLRKAYAVEEFARTGNNLKKVQKLLNHSSEAVTMLYAMANVLGKKKRFENVGK